MLPVPVEPVLVPWMRMELRRKWRLATVALAGCVAGALVGFGVGFWLFDELGRRLLAGQGPLDAYRRFGARFEDWGFWAIGAVGVPPIRFQAAMLAAGVAAYPLWLFLPATPIGRGVRYYGLAVLVQLAGVRALALWRRRRVAVPAVLTLASVALALLSRWLAG